MASTTRSTSWSVAQRGGQPAERLSAGLLRSRATNRRISSSGASAQSLEVGFRDSVGGEEEQFDFDVGADVMV
jgi:hypothetical protein